MVFRPWIFWRKLGDGGRRGVHESLGKSKVIAMARETKVLEELTVEIEMAVRPAGEVALHIGKSALSPEFKVAFAHAFPFMEVMGDVVMAGRHRGGSFGKAEAQAEPGKRSVDFYRVQSNPPNFLLKPSADDDGKNAVHCQKR